MNTDTINVMFSTVLEKFDGNLWGLHVKVPDVKSDQLMSTGNKRWMALLNKKATIRCALMPSKTGYFININQQLAKKLAIQVGDPVHFEMTPDTSEYGMEMPEELQVTFDQEPEAFDLFDKLTPGKKRNLIYIVSKVKNSNSRIKKSLAIVAHLKEVQGRLDFKKLNETIKYYNNQL
jgi:hypothetical protein